MTTKRIIILPVLLMSLATAAQTQRIRDLFAAAPDEVLPLMTKNNRLDCIDFIENKMEARVKDKFDNDVILEELTDDYLRIVTSSASTVEMKLVYPAASDGRRDTSVVVYVAETCKGPTADTQVRAYDRNWNFIREVPRPEVSEFIRQDSALSDDARTDIVVEAKILPLIKGSLSKTDDTLTWTLQTGEFTRETKQAADGCLQPVVVRL